MGKGFPGLQCEEVCLRAADSNRKPDASAREAMEKRNQLPAVNTLHGRLAARSVSKGLSLAYQHFAPDDLNRYQVKG